MPAIIPHLKQCKSSIKFCPFNWYFSATSTMRPGQCFAIYLTSGPSIKGICSHGEGGFISVVDIFRAREGEFFKCGLPHFLARKTSDFSKFMECSHGQGGGV